MATPYSFVVVRKDIPLANQIVQACHASREAGRKFQFFDNTHLVLCKTKNEEEFISVIQKIKDLGINLIEFYEPDFPEGVNAVCTEMVFEEKKSALGWLKLY